MKQKSVVWLYYDDVHIEHPILTQALQTLVKSGMKVWVIDPSYFSLKSNYRHIALGTHSAFIRKMFYINGTIQSVNTSGNDKINYRSKISILSVIIKIYKVSLALRAWISLFLIQPSVIIISKPTTAAVIAWKYKKLFGARLIYYPFEIYGEQHFEVDATWKRMEPILLSKGIDALITQNNHRAEIYLEKHACVLPVIVHNYKPYKKNNSNGKLHKTLKIASGVRIVLYVGYLIQGRCLRELVESVEYFNSNTCLVIVGRQSEWWESDVMPILYQNPQIRGKVHMSGWIAKDKLINNISDASAGVIIYDDKKINNYFCEPGKLSDYILAGVPVVAPNFPTIAPVINNYQIGKIFMNSSPKMIAKAINEVIDTPRSKWKKTLRKAQKELIWETQEKTFLSAING